MIYFDFLDVFRYSRVVFYLIVLIIYYLYHCNVYDYFDLYYPY